MLGNFFFSSTGEAAYEIEQSLRFDGSSGLTRTHSNNNTSSDFTLSMWFKKSFNSEDNRGLIHTNIDPRYSYLSFGESSGDADLLIARGTSSGYAFNTSRKYRDNSAWYHIVLSVDVGTLTEAYVNGVLDRNTGATSGWYFNGTDIQGLGRNANSATSFFQGYMAEVHFIDGQALDADNFGEFDNNGVWRPIEYTGTYGDNGYYLKFDPDATNGVGHDHSGNGNNWTASGFTTSGAGTDVMDDTPTNNFATLNPIDWSYTSGATLSNGNLYFTNSSTTAYSTVRTGFRVPASGKYYFEFTLGVASNHTTNVGLTDGNGNSWNWAHGSNTSQTKYNGTDQSTEGSSSNGVICAYAINNGQIRLYRGNSLIHTWSQSASGYVRAFVSCSWSNNVTFNFGQRAFNYTPPTDHVGWATANLPVPDIADGSDYFNTVLYTGNGTAGHAITGVGFQPDFVYIANRDRTTYKSVYDSVRGATKLLRSNTTDSEGTFSTVLTSFDSDGFTVGTDSANNGNNEALVAWNWLAGNGTSSNTAGSINSVVSVNQDAGFSIVSYTGNNTNAATVGHGLGKTPAFLITKSRDSAISPAWHTSHVSLAANYDLALDSSTAAWNPSSNGWHELTNSSVFTLKNGTTNGNNVNKSGDDYIAYCWAEIEGYSKFGSYTGNGLNDGPFVWCGFKPAVLITKNTVGTQDWQIRDDQRLGYNPTDRTLAPNDTRSENSAASSYNIDFLSNGFKIRGGLAAINGNGNKIVFAAFASSPFGGEGVSPATAR